MLKEIKIGEKVIPMKASAFTPFLFKEQFNSDIITEMQKMQKSGEIDSVFLARLAWVMARSADKNLPKLEEWLGDFEMLDLYMAAPQIIELWGGNSIQHSSPVKK